MDTPICTIHNTPCVLKPAGVIKTGARAGQPYEAFWSCPVKAPDGSYCKFKPKEVPTPTDKFKSSLESDDKESNIRWCNALNNACLLIAHNKVPLPDPQLLENTILMVAHQIFNLKP